MWPVQAPSETAQETYILCVSRIRNPARRQELQAATDIVVEAAGRFERAARGYVLHALKAEDFKLADMDDRDLAKVYTNGMAAKESPGREIYDRIIQAPRYGRCPLCGHRDVKTLDHHLPKATFPILSVAPFNLIPCCSDCNAIKSDRTPCTAEEQTIHPYFDRINDDKWLRAVVIEGTPPTLDFFVDPPACWNELLVGRVHRHFVMFGLSKLYSLQANGEMSGIRQYLRRLLVAGGVSLVADHLRAEAESRRADNLNGWQGVMYQALANSAWYCAGGFDC